MGKLKRSRSDRRSGNDRREAYDLEYFIKGGKERRRWVERRWRAEMRKGWARVSRWRSEPVAQEAETAPVSSDDS